MPLKKLTLKSGVNRENTRYTNEGGWYESDKVRFRQGTPEKLGGWAPYSRSIFLGICRSLWNWVTLTGDNLLSLGTNLKFYIEKGGAYYDITPIRGTATLTNPFVTAVGSPIVSVTATAHGGTSGDFVTFSGASALGGLTLNGEYQITVLTNNSYTITASSNATSTAGPGGGTVTATYQISVGAPYATPITGWGSSTWGSGTWGVGGSITVPLRLWSQSNFGENLVFGPRGGAIYYWVAASGVSTRGVPVTGLSGASDVPVLQNYLFVSDTSRFVFAMGCSDIGSGTIDPMLIRWSDQESVVDWTPTATNQAGSLRLSHGSEIITALQSRQEVVVWTDATIYSLQYAGAPVGWTNQILGDNISIAGQNAASLASGVIYWMGVDKFYKYDGRVQTLSCDLRQFVYGDINLAQKAQFFSSTNEGFNEVWWFYCSADSTVIDRYVIYNYLENVWYYGNMTRTSWLDSGLRDTPIATTIVTDGATPYGGRVLNHETGVDDNVDGNPVGMVTLISSSEFDIDDGDSFGFVYRILPDLTFRGSTDGTTPQITMTLIPMVNSGSGYNDPQSQGGSSYAAIQRITSVPVEEFTGQIYVRVRGRQMILQVESSLLGTQWQLGSPRIDIRKDGRRGNT